MGAFVLDFVTNGNRRRNRQGRAHEVGGAKKWRIHLRRMPFACALMLRSVGICPAIKEEERKLKEARRCTRWPPSARMGCMLWKRWHQRIYVEFEAQAHHWMNDSSLLDREHVVVRVCVVKGYIGAVQCACGMVGWHISLRTAGRP